MAKPPLSKGKSMSLLDVVRGARPKQRAEESPDDEDEIITEDDEVDQDADAEDADGAVDGSAETDEDGDDGTESQESAEAAAFDRGVKAERKRYTQIAAHAARNPELATHYIETGETAAKAIAALKISGSAPSDKKPKGQSSALANEMQGHGTGLGVDGSENLDADAAGKKLSAKDNKIIEFSRRHKI